MKIDKDELRRAATKSLFGIGIAALVFAALMALLATAAFLQLKLNDPLASPALVTLYQRLRESPADQSLKDDIRALDLLARRAYFTSRQQATSGGVLVFAGAAVFVLAFALREALRKKLPASPKGRPVPEPLADRLRARGLVAVAGAALMAGSFILIFAIAPLMDAFRGAGASGGDSNPPTQTSPTPSAAVIQINADWPDYRGPLGRGIAPAGDYPTYWDGKSGEGILWKVKPRLPGNNSPVVSANGRGGGRVFISGAVKTEAEIYGYDAATGKLLFTTRVEFSAEGKKAKVDEQNVGYAASTLAADDKYVAGIFAGGDVVGLDRDGKILWQKNLGTPELNYGYASSPIVWNGLLIVQFDSRRKPRLIALDLATGQTRWETAQDVLSSWASPVMAVIKGKPAVVVSTNPYVSAFDADTGAELWSVDMMTGEVGSSPTFADNVVYAGNENAELAALNADDGSKLWEYYEDLPHVSSPVVSDGLLFMDSIPGIVTCLDAKTGKLVWRQDFTDGFYASPILVGSNLYLMDREGVTHIVAAKREFTHTTACALGEPADATPAFAGNRIYIRGKTNLYCIGK